MKDVWGSISVIYSLIRNGHNEKCSEQIIMATNQNLTVLVGMKKKKKKNKKKQKRQTCLKKISCMMLQIGVWHQQQKNPDVMYFKLSPRPVKHVWL